MENKALESMNKMLNEDYESPRINVIEMEIEGPILQMSGEDSEREEW